MAEGIGSPIRKDVVDQIEARKKVVGKSTSRTSDDLLYLNSKTGWIRLSSGVNTITDEEAQTLLEQKGKLTIKGSNKLAGYNILQGGLLEPSRWLRQGIETSTTYNEGAAYNNRANSTGIRPMPGITAVSVTSKNTLGTLREAEVEISVWTLEDFEIIERIYLRPGFTMMLEWGHSMYITNKGELRKDIQTVGNKFFKEVSMTQILNEIKEKREQSNFNYEGMIGYVKNIDWSYTPDGCYKCKVTIISTGEILDSLKVRINPKLRGIDTKEFAAADKDKGKEQRKSPFHFFFDKLAGISNVRFTNQTLALHSPDMAARLLPFTAYFKPVQAEDHPDNAWYRFDPIIKHYWLPLRTYLDLFNKYVTLVDATQTKDGPDYAVAKFNTDYAKSSKFLTIPEHFSIDPTVCLLAHNHDIPALANDQFGIVPNVHNNLIAPENGYDDVLNILVASPFVKGILDAAMGEDYESEKGVTEIFREILSGINTALGNINDLDMYFDEDDSTFYIVDRNNTPKEKSPQLTLSGLDSVFTDIGISSVISNQVGSQIAIAAQGSSQNFTENIENILRWNPNVVDRIRPIKEPSEEVKEGQEEIKQEKEEEWKEWYEDVSNFFGEFSGNGYQDADMQAAKTMHKEYITYALYAENTENGDPPPGLVPVELSLQLEGIGGFKVGQTFTIKSGILPTKYQDKFGYLITGLSHTISGNRWLTDIKTQFYLTEKGKPQGIPSGQKRKNKLRDPAAGSPPVSRTAGGTSRKLGDKVYKNGQVPEDKLRYINNWKSYKGAVDSDDGKLRFYVDASRALDSLLAAAEKDNIKFKINGAYRTYDDQVEVKRKFGSDAATPGTSPHGFGLAVDFSTPKDLKRIKVGSDQYEWLVKNASKYSFARLPWKGTKHGESWESWHWEYQI